MSLHLRFIVCRYCIVIFTELFDETCGLPHARAKSIMRPPFIFGHNPLDPLETYFKATERQGRPFDVDGVNVGRCARNDKSTLARISLIAGVFVEYDYDIEFHIVESPARAHFTVNRFYVGEIRDAYTRQLQHPQLLPLGVRAQMDKNSPSVSRAASWRRFRIRYGGGRLREDAEVSSGIRGHSGNQW